MEAFCCLHVPLHQHTPSSGLTSAKELPSFRASHMVTVKPFDVTKSQKSPSLPSDRSRKHTYGMASSYRSAEVIRACGPEEPPVKWLVQGETTVPPTWEVVI